MQGSRASLALTRRCHYPRTCIRPLGPNPPSVCPLGESQHGWEIASSSRRVVDLPPVLVALPVSAWHGLFLEISPGVVPKGWTPESIAKELRAGQSAAKLLLATTWLVSWHPREMSAQSIAALTPTAHPSRSRPGWHWHRARSLPLHHPSQSAIDVHRSCSRCARAPEPLYDTAMQH